MKDPQHVSDELSETLESLRRAIETNPREPPTEAAEPLSTPVIQLPLWPGHRRAAPNALFRSALFPALNFRQGRPFLKNQHIASVGGISVLFTGESFDQSDLDVYLELLNLAREHPLGTECSFSAHGMLKLIGRQTGYSDHKWLHAVLVRLSGGVVDITDHKKRYFGTLIGGGFKDEATKRYCIHINPEFAVLFGYGMWSTIDREQRRALRRSVTAKALHVYYATHAPPGPHKFDTLAELAGLNNPNRRQQRLTLIKAHRRLADKEIGFLTHFEHNGNTITVYLNPTPSQARHIARRATKCGRTRPRRRARDSVDSGPSKAPPGKHTG
jgi:hypothetical protein